MNSEKAAGMVAGIVCGVVIGLIVLRVINGKKGLADKYDEMQLAVRGNAYKYAFCGVLIYEAVMFLLNLFEVRIPIDHASAHMLGIFIGILIQVSYCIWHDAYFGLNTNRTRFGIVFVLASICNLIPAAGAIASGEMFAEGRLAVQFINLLCVIVFAVIGIELLLKSAADRKAGEAG